MSGGGGRPWLVPLALLVTGALAFLATRFEADGIESDLLARSRSALADAGLPGASVSFEGRDATVSGLSAREAEWAVGVVAGVEGVRAADAAESTPRREPGVPEDARQRLQAELDGLLATQPISFQPDTAVLTPEGESAMTAVLELLGTTPTDIRFEVGGHVARLPGGDPAGARALSQERADAVAQRLIASGIANTRVTAIGYGDTRPLSPSGDTGADRRVEITVR
ncbi:hypothetical protein DI005_36915 [Prauserella sp. PE36]|uniref:OmpA family protein n=1 Tax=Prauserella endophytica TaxID=1592324 RepID=A0ABY2RUM1_9PSEU|nr:MULTISPECIES: OmpA family protein [Prauserella]PXY37160.1 hypothetical protein BAY59_00800 [Prauserella coralliicola]RBM10191.1 hypothetical protein DI005_36915 [Prauserella sp. PE36]TKG61069.1 OmpA family protein [Prauserella endophytica]